MNYNMQNNIVILIYARNKFTNKYISFNVQQTFDTITLEIFETFVFVFNKHCYLVGLEDRLISKIYFIFL